MGLFFTIILRIPLPPFCVWTLFFLDGLCIIHNGLSYAAVTNDPTISMGYNEKVYFSYTVHVHHGLPLPLCHVIFVPGPRLTQQPLPRIPLVIKAEEKRDMKNHELVLKISAQKWHISLVKTIHTAIFEFKMVTIQYPPGGVSGGGGNQII